MGRYPYHDLRAMKRSPSPRPWRPDFRGTTGVSLSFPSYLVRNPNQALHGREGVGGGLSCALGGPHCGWEGTGPRAPQLEETPETPPSSRAEGLLFLHGLESNPESSLQTPQEA